MFSPGLRWDCMNPVLQVNHCDIINSFRAGKQRGGGGVTEGLIWFPTLFFLFFRSFSHFFSSESSFYPVLPFILLFIHITPPFIIPLFKASVTPPPR